VGAAGGRLRAKNPENKEEIVRSSTMVITEPNQFVAQYHDRMPVVLDRTTASADSSTARRSRPCAALPRAVDGVIHK